MTADDADVADSRSDRRRRRHHRTPLRWSRRAMGRLQAPAGGSWSVSSLWLLGGCSAVGAAFLLRTIRARQAAVCVSPAGEIRGGTCTLSCTNATEGTLGHRRLGHPGTL